MPIKTFRGLLTDTETKRIRLGTVNGMTGYRIKKFQLIAHKPGAQEYETTVTIQKVAFDGSPSNDINFDDANILAVGYMAGHDGTTYPQVNEVLIFDNSIVNQDIYIGANDRQSNAMNYYLELEQVKLNANSQAVVTLKDIRSNTT
tara:strand:+ start:877 stop:1314 length:438 start_codon:yes stop_codon:yes gene_type:complete